jgi:hypothetical protein
MKMKLQVLGVALVGAALFGVQARAETINFDNLGNMVTVTNQYPNVVFSAGGGDVVLTTCQNNAACTNPGPPYLGSPPNLICTGTVGNPVDCTHDVTLTFTTLVDNITFTAYGNQTAAPGQFALADVYQGGILTHPNIPLLVSHTTHCASPTLDCAGDPQALNFTGISRLTIHGNTDQAGTAYDDFNFAVEGVGAPEPSTLILTGLCGIVLAGRSFLKRKRA